MMMVIGAVGPLTIDSSDLLGKRASVKGWYSGIARDSEDTLNFSQPDLPGLLGVPGDLTLG